MNNHMGSWYTEGITIRRKCRIGNVESEPIILSGNIGYNRLRAAIRRLDNGDQICAFGNPNVPMLIYNTMQNNARQNVVVSAFYDQKNCGGIEMYSYDAVGILTLAMNIGLPIEKLELMMSNPEKFPKRKDIASKTIA